MLNHQKLFYVVPLLLVLGCNETIHKNVSGTRPSASNNPGLTAGGYCIHAPDAECHIWNSCYDCSAHQLIQLSNSSPAGCVAPIFESKCRGETVNLQNENNSKPVPYVFVNKCVVDVLKKECGRVKMDGFDLCDPLDPGTIDGCPVKGFSMDCVNLSLWTCENQQLLLGQDDADSSEDVPFVFDSSSI